MELGVWAEHCQSEKNAKEFVLDAKRDVNDVLKVPDGIFSNTYSFMAARTESIQQDKAMGFETLDSKYKTVSDAARELGKGEPFRVTNKLLSKYAHPTALQVVYNGGEAEEILKEKFYDLGMALSKGALSLLANRQRK